MKREIRDTLRAKAADRIAERLNQKLDRIDDKLNRRLGPELAKDVKGRLYSSRMRDLFGELKVDVSVIEALSAVRFAGRSIHLLQERWAEQHDLSEGRLSV